MCLIIAAAVSYISVKMARHFPDKKIWALVGFTSVTFIVGIVTMAVGIAYIKSSQEEPCQPTTSEQSTYSVSADQNYMQMRFSDKHGIIKLLIKLTQSPDGRTLINHTLTKSLKSDLEDHLIWIQSWFRDEDNNVGSMNMTLTDMQMKGSVAVYEVSWTSDVNWLQPADCIEMAKTEDNWFGGAQMFYQWWPINRWDKYMSYFLSGDMYANDQDFGSVLERYWLSSSGAGLYVDADVPLHVSIENNRICFKGTFSESPYQATQSSAEGLPNLKYKILLSPDARTTHEFMFSDSGILKRPTDLPDKRMIKSPIWSTWARYKKNVSQETVLNYADEIEANGFSYSQLEIDDGYESVYGDITFDAEKFPDPKKMIDELHNRDFRVTIWVTPFVNVASINYDTHPEYFVKNGNGDPGRVTWWDGVGRIIDFTNKDACDWYYGNLQNIRTSVGVDSFKFDAGEVNYVSKISGYQTETFLRNLGDYTLEYNECSHRLGNLIENRASWRSQHLPVFFRMMDKDSNWTPAKGLKTLIPTALTFSLLGYPYVLPDMIGGNGYENGFANQYLPERELYIRWIQITAFLPAMQFSISPWQYDNEVVRIAKHFIEIHETIAYEELIKSFQEYVDGTAGMGAIRPLWWISPTDTDSFLVDDEFLVGDRYLVAPIVENATRSRDIYLPGPIGRNGQTLRWTDKLRGDGPSVQGGQTIKNYPVALDELSYWELA